MKKRMKMAVLTGTVVMLSAGAALNSYAAWEQEDGEWVYLDSNGSRVTNSWKKSGDNSFYLDSDGLMVVDSWIDDTYYVDEAGVMQTNCWIYVDPGSEDSPNTDGGWFYLDANGKVVTDGWKTINEKKYNFDTDGTMKYGWLADGDNLYYLGDENDGAAKTGWLHLDFDSDEIPEDGEVSTVMGGNEAGGKWFYFLSTGKAAKATGENSYIAKTIDGYKYYFDENGVMATGWTAVEEQESGDVTGISTLKYFGEENDGKMTKGWRFITDSPEDSETDFDFTTATSSNAESTDSGDGAWYYFDSNGVPKYLSASASTVTEATTRLNGKTYFFNEYGQMQSGLIGFELSDGTVCSVYFGSSDSDGVMKIDRQTGVVDGNGDTDTYYFTPSGENKGSGYTGVKNDYLYDNGKLVTAEDGTNVQVFQVNDTLYLVNESGKIQTSNKAYKSDGEYLYEYNNGTIYLINSDKERLYEVTSGELLSEASFKTIYSLNNTAV